MMPDGSPRDYIEVAYIEELWERRRYPWLHEDPTEDEEDEDEEDEE